MFATGVISGAVGSQARMKASHIGEVQMIDASDKGRLDKLAGDAQNQLGRIRENLGRALADNTAASATPAAIEAAIGERAHDIPTKARLN